MFELWIEYHILRWEKVYNTELLPFTKEAAHSTRNVISSPYPIVRVLFLYCLYPILSCNYHILLLCVYPIIPRAYPNARTSSRMYIVRIYSILCDCACIISYLAFNLSCVISYPILHVIILSTGFALFVVFM